MNNNDSTRMNYDDSVIETPHAGYMPEGKKSSAGKTVAVGAAAGVGGAAMGAASGAMAANAANADVEEDQTDLEVKAEDTADDTASQSHNHHHHSHHHAHHPHNVYHQPDQHVHFHNDYVEEIHNHVQGEHLAFVAGDESDFYGEIDPDTDMAYYGDDVNDINVIGIDSDSEAYAPSVANLMVEDDENMLFVDVEPDSYNDDPVNYYEPTHSVYDEPSYDADVNVYEEPVHDSSYDDAYSNDAYNSDAFAPSDDFHADSFNDSDAMPV